VAWYKYLDFLTQKTNEEFDKLHKPGEDGEWSGIYRCTGCGREVVHTQGKSLPPQNHHTHTTEQGKILWQLVVTDKAP
jgi:hypothetical protein